MADKYNSEIKNGTVVLTIPDGPAAGSYVNKRIEIDGAGMILIGVMTIAGQRRALKVKASEMPEYVAKFAQLDAERKAAREAYAASPAGIEAARQAHVDAQMRRAGFEAAGNGAEIWNSLNPVNGDNF